MCFVGTQNVKSAMFASLPPVPPVRITVFIPFFLATSIALMTFAEGGYVSPECIVLTVRQGKDGQPLVKPEVLAAILRSDLVFGQIMHLIAGIGRPRLNTTCLRKVLIPLPPLAVQSEGRHEFEGRLSSARELRAKANALLHEADSLEITAVEELAQKMIEG